MHGDDFLASIRDELFERITTGPRDIVLWGFNKECVKLIVELQSLGLSGCVRCIVDGDVEKQRIKDFLFPIRPISAIREVPLDTLVILLNKEKEEALREFVSIDDRKPHIIIAGSEHFAFDSKEFYNLLNSNPVKPKSWGNPNMLIHIYQCVKHLLETGRRGAIVEFGAFNCGTSVLIARILAKLNTSTKIIALDTFAEYPPPRHALDLFVSKKCECPDSTMVKHLCDKFGIEQITGDICNTYTQIQNIPLMLTFFDTDNYSPTRAALELCYEQTIQGGVLAFDHFHSENWVRTVGERIAIKEVLEGKGAFNLYGTGIFFKA